MGGLTSTNFRRIWLHGKTEACIERIKRDLFSAQDVLVGWSSVAREQGVFPNGALVPALHTAMRGALDLLLIEETWLAQLTPSQASNLVQLFADYGVTVKSFSSFGSSNS